jgi:hypothetical protein|tara:strand:- start:1271 stop:1705 length:435 start_codon:yes stop_codon:yes gene_type:complete
MLINSLIAGFLGTLVMTFSQLIEMFITKRKGSNSPAIAFSKIFRINLNKFSERGKTILTYAVHFIYGTFWALAVYVLYLFGIQSTTYLIIIYFLITTIQGWIVIPLLNIGPNFWKWGIHSILSDAFHHLVLATATVLIFLTLIS